MAFNVLKRKAKRNVERTIERKDSIKSLNFQPVQANVDVEAIKASFAKGDFERPVDSDANAK